MQGKEDEKKQQESIKTTRRLTDLREKTTSTILCSNFKYPSTRSSFVCCYFYILDQLGMGFAI